MKQERINAVNNTVILNLIQDLQRLLLLFINSVRGRFRIKYTMTSLCNNGFTLIELLVVVLIIGILAAVAVPQYQKAVEKSRATQALTLLKSLVPAQKAYYLANGQYATKFDQLDVDMPGWTGKEKWADVAADTRSNGEWSLQIFHFPSGSTRGDAIYIGRISGKYKGIGLAYWFYRPAGDNPIDIIYCFERTNDGKIFDGADGDYCHKILGGTKYNNQARVYTLPY